MGFGCHRSKQDAEGDAHCILRSSMDFEENYKLDVTGVNKMLRGMPVVS
jgi:hypothetical protein